MFSFNLEFEDDPLECHDRYEKIRNATWSKNNVHIALDRNTNRNVAIKCFKRGPEITEAVRREILYHAELSHLNVVSLYLCISLELGAQNLWQHVHAKGGCLSEDEAQFFFIQLINGVNYCHSQSVANRDIKLENCLICPSFRNGRQHNILKICDFGYCKNLEKDSLPDSLVGTAAYLSLDVLLTVQKKGYDAKLVDIWSCGVVLYYLIEGRFPFGTELSNGGRSALWTRVSQLEYDMCTRGSYGVRDLLSRIFCPAEYRIDLAGIMDHWWVRQGYKREDVKKLPPLSKASSGHLTTERQSKAEIESLIQQAIVAPLRPNDYLDDYMIDV